MGAYDTSLGALLVGIIINTCLLDSYHINTVNMQILIIMIDCGWGQRTWWCDVRRGNWPTLPVGS